jgi:hypothetical protein
MGGGLKLKDGGFHKTPIGEEALHRIDAVIKILKDLGNKLALA